MHSSKVFQDISAELLSRGHGMRFRAEGRSMHPTIRDGEAITVEPVAPHDVKRGDILLFRGAKGVLAHRVIAIPRKNGSAAGSFVLRGDASSTCDGSVRSGRVLGRVVAVERDGHEIAVGSKGAKILHAARVWTSRMRTAARFLPGTDLGPAQRRWLNWLRVFAGLLLVLISAAQVQAQGIVFDASSSADSGTSNQSSLTFSHTVGAGGTNRLLLVGVSIQNNASQTVSSVTYAGVNLTNAGVRANAQNVRIEIWRLVAPATGTNNVTVTLAGGATRFVTGAASLTGINQTTPLGSFSSATGSSTTPSVNVTGVLEGEVVIDIIGATEASGTTQTANAGAGQTAGFIDKSNVAGSTDVLGAGSGESSPAGGGTVTMSWTLGLSNPWAIGAAAIKPANATAVRLVSFTAAESSDGVLLKWRTGHEVNNLGFHVYREGDGERVRLTPELVAGSALLIGSGTALRAGRSYSWWDNSFSSQEPLAISYQPSEVAYWLEDVDLNGKRTRHGPVTPVLSQEILPKAVKPELLTELSRRLNRKYDDFWRAQDLKDKLSRNFPTGSVRSTRVFERTSRAFEQERTKRSFIQSDQPSDRDRLRQRFLAGGPAVKLSVKEAGWYRVSQADLRAAGLGATVNPRQLKLYKDGREQPIKVLSRKTGRSNSLVAIEFYGVGLDTPSADTRVYWLIEGSRPGKRIDEFRSRKGKLLAPPSFPYTVEKKERAFYFAALKNGEAESFFGPMITAEPVDQLLLVSHLDPLPPGEATLEVDLQGLTNLPHRVKVLFNELEAGEVTFEGQSRASVGFSIPQSYLVDGENLVTLVSQGGEMDLSLIDEIRLTYWHTYSADGDILRMTAQGGEQLTIDGFSQSEIRVIDVTDSTAVREVAGVIEPKGSGYAVTVEVPGFNSRTLLAFTKERIMQPASIAANQPSNWHQRGKRADLLIIAHKEFLEQAEPLKILRQAQGFSAALVDAEDLYDEFNFGAKSPEAIKDFLALTKANSKAPPRFVLLLGDASVDPKNYLGFGDFDFVPTKLVETALLKTASDDWFVDFNGDGLPEMALGRLPVRTAEEAATVISKIISYEQGAGGMLTETLLVADKNDGFDFERANEELEALLPSSIKVQKIFRENFGTDAEANSALISSMNRGSLLVNYIGHGSVEILRGMLSSDDARSLTNGARLPFFVTMTCLTGLFHDVFTESLAETLLKAEQGGAVAVWASSGLTEPAGQAVVDQELMRLLFNGEQLALGEATARAKARVNDPDIHRTWILFGDPTTRLR